MGRLATAEEIAETFVYLVSDESSFMTGQAVFVDGGMACNRRLRKRALSFPRFGKAPLANARNSALMLHPESNHPANRMETR